MNFKNDLLNFWRIGNMANAIDMTQLQKTFGKVDVVGRARIAMVCEELIYEGCKENNPDKLLAGVAMFTTAEMIMPSDEKMNKEMIDHIVFIHERNGEKRLTGEEMTKRLNVASKKFTTLYDAASQVIIELETKKGISK